MKRRCFSVLGVKIDCLTLDQAVEKVSCWIADSHKKRLIVTPNPEFLVRAQSDQNFKHILNQAGMAICDGWGLVAAGELLLKIKNQKSKIKNKYKKPENKIDKIISYIVSRHSESRQSRAKNPIISRGDPSASTRLSLRMTAGKFCRILRDIQFGSQAGWKLLIGSKNWTVFPERVAGINLLVELVRMASKKRWRVFLLGGQPENLSQKAAETLKDKFPGLAIAAHKGHSDITATLRRTNTQENETIIKTINQFKPDIVFAAYGAPSQEYWISGNINRIEAGVLMGVGGAFNQMENGKWTLNQNKFGSGQTIDDNQWQLKISRFEWLKRLIREPKRFKRIIKAVVVFPWLVWNDRL